MVKVRLSDKTGHHEHLWASLLEDGHYRLENSPFFAYEVSWQDVIEAQPDESGMLVFVRVVEKSGNRTVRVILKPPPSASEASQNVLATLEDFGCSYEGLNPSYISVNVPAEIEIKGIYSYLTDSQIQWECGDPSYNQLTFQSRER